MTLAILNRRRRAAVFGSEMVRCAAIRLKRDFAERHSKPQCILVRDRM